jgi:hypothetical protein
MLKSPLPCQRVLASILAETATVARDTLARVGSDTLIRWGYCRHRIGTLEFAALSEPTHPPISDCQNVVLPRSGIASSTPFWTFSGAAEGLALDRPFAARGGVDRGRARTWRWTLLGSTGSR